MCTSGYERFQGYGLFSHVPISIIRNPHFFIDPIQQHDSTDHCELKAIIIQGAIGFLVIAFEVPKPRLINWGLCNVSVLKVQS